MRCNIHLTSLPNNTKQLSIRTWQKRGGKTCSKTYVKSTRTSIKQDYCKIKWNLNFNSTSKIFSYRKRFRDTDRVLSRSYRLWLILGTTSITSHFTVTSKLIDVQFLSPWSCWVSQGCPRLDPGPILCLCCEWQGVTTLIE